MINFYKSISREIINRVKRTGCTLLDVGGVRFARKSCYHHHYKRTKCQQKRIQPVPVYDTILSRS